MSEELPIIPDFVAELHSSWKAPAPVLYQEVS